MKNKNFEHAYVNGNQELLIYKDSCDDGIHKMRITTKGCINVDDTIGRRDTIFRLVEILEQRNSMGSWEDGIETIGYFEVDIHIRNNLQFYNGISNIVIESIKKLEKGFKFPAIGRQGNYELIGIKKQKAGSIYETEGRVRYIA